jgi:hypothetical protein
MSATATAEPVVTPQAPQPYRRVAAVVALLVAGGAIGFGIARFLDDPQTAKPEHLVGSVDWSNQSTNTISFRADGDSSTSHQVFYQLVTSGADYPPCLVASASNPVRQDHRRVSLDVIRADYGGKQKINVAISLTCEN